jgi:hypothetical protein
VIATAVDNSKKSATQLDPIRDHSAHPPKMDVTTLTGTAFLGAKPLSKDLHKDIRFVSSKSRLSASESESESSMGPCKNCVYVLERIKQGYQYLLPSICVEIYSKESSSEEYSTCHQVLASLSVWGHNVRHWFHYGCYKSESYGAMELIRPCPSHVICAQIADFKKSPFCEKPPSDFTGNAGAEATF